MKNYFQFDKYGTNFKREILGGITTFLSMAYILAVNPQVLSLAASKLGSAYYANLINKDNINGSMRELSIRNLRFRYMVKSIIIGTLTMQFLATISVSIIRWHRAFKLPD